jgi:hypothetical protein
MRAFASFLVVLVLVGAIGYAGLLFLRDNADKLREGSLPAKIGKDLRASTPDGKLPPSGPKDYHLLEGMGGIPAEEARLAGLVTDRWAYLVALDPVQQSEGVEPVADVTVRGLHYDHCFKYKSTSPEFQYLEFSIGAKWDELHFGFGFSDTEPSDPSNALAIELTVLADGKTVYGPRRLTPVDKPSFAMLDVRGVSRIVFSSKRIAQANYFEPLLLDPFLKRSEAESSDSTDSSASATIDK